MRNLSNKRWTSRSLAWKPADANTRGTRYTCGVHTLLPCPHGNPNPFALHICDCHCCGCTHGNCQGALRHLYVGRTCSTLANGSCADGHVARVHMVNGQYAQTIFMGDEKKNCSLYCFVQCGPSSHFTVVKKCCPWSIEIRRTLYRQNPTKNSDSMILHVSRPSQ